MPTQTKPFGDFASVELLEAPSEFTWKDIAENKFEFGSSDLSMLKLKRF